MFKKLVITFVLILLLASCGEDKEDIIDTNKDTIITVNEYISYMSDEKTSDLQTKSDLLLHPLKDAIELYGNDYDFSWEGGYVMLKFGDAKCSFESCVGAAFEQYDWYNNYIDINDCNVMEYLSFAAIDKVIFDGKDMTLTDGISIGMTADQIAEELGVTSIDYSNSCSMITTEYNSNGEKVKVYTTFGETSDADYAVIFEEDVLARVEITSRSRYLNDENTDGDNGKQIIDQAFLFITENELATFDADELSYKGKKYSSYYDSWFNSWQFTKGVYEGYEINVEQNKPNRVYITSSAGSFPITFWCDGKYINPMLSFLGKWRDYNTNEYIDIKSISKEGIVIFDMYVDIANGEEMILLENLNTAINDIPQSLDAYLYAESIYESLDGDIQFFNGEVQSGYYGLAGDKYYLMDSLIMDLTGSVKYLPRGYGNRMGTGTLTVHIPNKNQEYTQAATWGYMENFGRDDQNPDNIITTNTSGGESVINDYLNTLYETSNLKYADIEYSYLYDYVFPMNDTIYNVWKSNDAESPYYLYVDSDKEMIIKESRLNMVSKHTKELIWKSHTMVDKRSYAYQKCATLDGKITIDLENRKITNKDAFVKEIDISEIGIDTVGINERFMWFSEIGERFALNGYVLFDHTTWGATLHITDSNIPEFDIGVYYLNSETFFLDETIGVVAVPEESEGEDYVDDKVDDIKKETKLVIRDFGGKIIGYIYVQENGDKTVKDFYGKILGYYRASTDVTTDFYGKILYRGDASAALLFNQ